MNVMRDTVIISTGINSVTESRSKARNQVTPILSVLQIEEARLRGLLTQRIDTPRDAATERLDDESNDVISTLAQLALANKRSAEASYVPLPVRARFAGGTTKMLSWRIELCGLKGDPLGVELFDDVVLGRGPEADVDLDPFDAYAMAVSRRHAMLRPTCNHLHLMDLGSTNGTMYNTVPLGRCVTYQLRDQDVISLGLLTFTIKIVAGPAV